MRFAARLAAVTLCLMASGPMAALAADNAPAKAPSAKPQLHIDVPVELKKADVVYNMDHPSFAGDEPVGLKYLDLMSAKFARDHTEGHIVAVFHGQLGYMLLNDATYAKNRKIKSGNPYKAQIEELIKRGVQIEECAVTAQGNHWTNADLLPGVKVNAGAVGRIIQLVQDGYVQIHP